MRPSQKSMREMRRTARRCMQHLFRACTDRARTQQQTQTPKPSAGPLDDVQLLHDTTNQADDDMATCDDEAWSLVLSPPIQWDYGTIEVPAFVHAQDHGDDDCNVDDDVANALFASASQSTQDVVRALFDGDDVYDLDGISLDSAFSFGTPPPSPKAEDSLKHFWSTVHTDLVLDEPVSSSTAGRAVEQAAAAATTHDIW